jgi:hypothetical protein
MEPERFALQAPHPITEKGKEFLASLNQKDRALQDMMSKSLGSSYFVERTHAFRKWITLVQQQPQHQQASAPTPK